MHSRHRNPRRRIPVRKPIWIVSKDKSLFDWASKVFGKERAIIEVDHESIPTKHFPALILLGCDYQCQCDICASRFQVPLIFPAVTTFIARPVLAKKWESEVGEFLISDFSGPRSNQKLYKIDELRQFELHQRFLEHSHNPASRIIRLQQQIVHSRGKANRVSELAKQIDLSSPRLSAIFKQGAGVPMKSFLNKVRLCRCLWELISSDKPIKTIALEFGYKPVSLSLKFRQTFGSWASEIRRLKG